MLPSAEVANVEAVLSKPVLVTECEIEPSEDPNRL